MIDNDPLLKELLNICQVDEREIFKSCVTRLEQLLLLSENLFEALQALLLAEDNAVLLAISAIRQYEMVHAFTIGDVPWTK